MIVQFQLPTQIVSRVSQHVELPVTPKETAQDTCQTHVTLNLKKAPTDWLQVQPHERLFLRICLPKTSMFPVIFVGKQPSPGPSFSTLV